MDTATDEPRVLDKLGLTLCIAAAIAAMSLNVATFLTTVARSWLIPTFLVSFAAVGILRRPSASGWRMPERALTWVGLGLFLYAALLFVIFFRTAGWISGVSIIDGQHVATYKNQIVRIITEQEYRMFPNLWLRAISALIAMGSVFSLASLRGRAGD